MARIRMSEPFGEENHVEKFSITNIEYGSTIEVPSDAMVIIEDFKTRNRHELARCIGNVFNPKPKGLGYLIKKTDPNSYIIFYVSRSNVTGKFGGNFNVSNKHIKELEYEKVFYQGNYQFKVSNCKRFIDHFISEDSTQYPRDYFREKTGKQIKSVIESIVSAAISDNGLSNFSANITDIIEKIENKLNESYALDAGIDIKIIDLNVIEDNKIKEIKEDTELRKYQRNMVKED